MKFFKNLWQKISLASLSVITLSQTRIPDLYGPPVDNPTPVVTGPIYALYGPPISPTPTPTPTFSMPLPQPVYGVQYTPQDFMLRILGIALWVLVPLAIIVAIIVGLVVYFRRKKAKSNSNMQVLYGVPRDKNDSNQS